MISGSAGIIVQVGLEVGDVKLLICASTIQYTSSYSEGTPLFVIEKPGVSAKKQFEIEIAV